MSHPLPILEDDSIGPYGVGPHTNFFQKNFLLPPYTAPHI